MTSTPVRVALFVTALALVFGTAWGAGRLVDDREGDLAYLHVHPEDGGAGPEVPFAVEMPSAGSYRLFFDFQHDGVVRTPELAVRSHRGGGPSHGH